MKIIFAGVAISIIIIGYIPYLKDIFARKTAPHIYTWLIWLITQSTAIAALIYGGGKMGGAGLVAGVILVFVIFLLAFKYGTKNITASDTILLAFSILAIAVWWQLDSPLLSVVIISLIDGIAYLPTFRKTYVIVSRLYSALAKIPKTFDNAIRAKKEAVSLCG